MPTRAENTIKKNLAIIEKALRAINEVTKGRPIQPVFLNRSEFEPVLVNRVWIEDFVDEDTGEVISIKRTEARVVIRKENKGVQVL